MLRAALSAILTAGIALAMALPQSGPENPPASISEPVTAHASPDPFRFALDLQDDAHPNG